MAILDEALTYVLANTSTGLFTNPSSTSPGVPIYLSRMPPDPVDVAVSLYEPGGAPPLGTLNDSAPTAERPRIQIYSRATSYQTARNNAQAIWDAFYTLRNTAIAKTGSTGTTLWHLAEPINSPTDIGRDGNERNIVTADIQVTKEMS